MTYCAWQPASGIKAGVMVFAGNVNKSYTDQVLAAVGNDGTIVIL